MELFVCRALELAPLSGSCNTTDGSFQMSCAVRGNPAYHMVLMSPSARPSAPSRPPSRLLGCEISFQWHCFSRETGSRGCSDTSTGRRCCIARDSRKVESVLLQEVFIGHTRLLHALRQGLCMVDTLAPAGRQLSERPHQDVLLWAAALCHGGQWYMWQSAQMYEHNSHGCIIDGSLPFIECLAKWPAQLCIHFSWDYMGSQG